MAAYWAEPGAAQTSASATAPGLWIKAELMVPKDALQSRLAAACVISADLASGVVLSDKGPPPRQPTSLCTAGEPSASRREKQDGRASSKVRHGQCRQVGAQAEH